MPQLMVSIAPLQPLADALLAGIGHSTVLARPGQDAHSMLLSPSQARSLEAADIILVPDRTLNSAIEKLAGRATQRGATLIALSDLPGAEPLPYPTRQRWLGEEKNGEHAHGEAARDPHLWLDPLRMAAVALPLAEALGDAMPAHRATLRANARALARHLRDDVHPNLTQLLSVRTGEQLYTARDFVPFISAHAGFQYFLQRYDIPDYGALITRPDDYLGARSLHALLARANAISVRCLMVESPTMTQQKFATATGARLVRISPDQIIGDTMVPALSWIQNDYDRLLYITAKAFAGCL